MGMDQPITHRQQRTHAAMTGSDQFEAAIQEETQAEEIQAAEIRSPAMTTTLCRDNDYQQAVATVSNATVQLHRAELALHDAHGSHVDAWISAASNKLHETVVRYEQARTTLATFAALAA
jgi:hypothetical protein